MIDSMDTLHSPPASRSGYRVAAAFARWYVGRAPSLILQSYILYAQAFAAMFSFVFLLKTLFAPWKSIQDSYPSKGFNLQKIFETFVFNLTARGIGFVIRVLAMIVGLLLQLLLLFLCMGYLLLWITFPIVVLFSIPLLIFTFLLHV